MRKSGLHKVVRFFYNIFMTEVVVKFANDNIINEIQGVGFDPSYLFHAVTKYKGKAIKIFNMKPHEANILKQSCLSLGFDCAVSRNSITCSCDYTDGVIFASNDGYRKLINKLKSQPFRLKEIALKIESALNNILSPLLIRNFLFDWKKPYVMGILNITPDSFSDGGDYFNPKSALDCALKMIDQGADIIDIGGESTRPNASFVSPDEEMSRVLPIVKLIRKSCGDIPISIDTRNFITAKAAIDEGADIINDVSGLDNDKKLFDFVCTNDIPVIIMHSDTVPAVSNNFVSKDIVDDIYKTLYRGIENLLKSGHSKTSIIADAGFGFGKSKDGCFELLKRYDEFISLGVPLLAGISRKSFIRNEFNINCDESDLPTAFYSAFLAHRGINIHRVHNVKLTKQFLDFAVKLT